MLLLLPLGCSNDASGQLDDDSPARVAQTLARYQEAVAAGKKCCVLPSGGADPAFAFNPTETPHWEYVSAALVTAGLPESALIRPGLPALHTVDEAIMARDYVLRSQGAIDEVLAITSDFHAARARHLFGVAFGGHAKCPVTAYVEDVPGALSGEALAERKAHEKAGLKTLRTAPFGAWASFVGEHGLEACNKSLRWSRMLPPAVYDTSVHGFNMVAPRPAGKLISASGAGGASGQAVYERTAASSPQLNVHTAPTPSALAPPARTGAEIRARYQAAVDVRLEQLARLTDEKVRRHEARLEQQRQRIESVLINEAFEEDEAGMPETISVHGLNPVAPVPPRPANKLISASGAGGASGQAIYVERTTAPMERATAAVHVS